MKTLIILIIGILSFSCSTQNLNSFGEISSIESHSEDLDALYKNPYAHTFIREDAPEGFFDWNDNITIGGVFKSYIPLPGLTLEEKKRRIISTLENVRIFSNMKFGDGKYIYEKAYCVDNYGDVTSDNIDGIISGDPEVRNVVFELEKLAIIGTIVVQANTYLYEDSNSITIDFASSDKVGVLVFRNLISAKGIRLTMTYTFTENGLIVDGKGSLKVNVLEGRVKTKTLKDLLKSFNEIATKKTMNPNYSLERSINFTD